MTQEDAQATEDDKEVIEQVRSAVIGIMSTMAMSEIEFLGDELQNQFLIEQEATGLVRLSGSHDGMMGVATDQTSLRLIVSLMVGLEAEALEREDLLDGIAELANMICGNFKARTRLGEMHLSSPVAMVGKEFMAEWKTNKPTKVLTFQIGEGTLQVFLSL